MKDKLKNNNHLVKPTSSWKSLELSSSERAEQTTASVSISSVLEGLEKNILEQVQWVGVNPPLGEGTVRYGPP